jgi:AcrR family transcriptional regulator
MDTRAAAADATRQRILDAAITLLKTKFRSDIRLEEIAAGAGVSVPTIVNNFGSKAELLAVALREVISRASAIRRSVDPADPASIIRGLCAHYESIGDWVLKNLAEEADKELLEIGRQRHREWVELYFGAQLQRFEASERATRFDALLACCDVYTWKILRRDLGRSVAAVEAAILFTVTAILRDA